MIERSAGAAQFGKVAVVMGGWSAEREVSLMSGRAVLDALRELGVDAHGVDADRGIAARLEAGGFARAFLILHGSGGEDGLVQAALELAGIPYTGSGVLASALSMDKQRAKELVSVHGVPVAPGGVADTLLAAQNRIAELGYPIVIKPVAEGSSIGVSLLDSERELAAAFDEARRYGPVLIERRLMGRELTAGILAGRCLPLVSMRAASGFYDYHAKYMAEDTEYECPVRINPGLGQRVEKLAVRAFEALGCAGWGRVDFMLDDNDEPYFIECNTAPGMTSHSLVPMAAAAAGIAFGELCRQILLSSLDVRGDWP